MVLAIVIWSVVCALTFRLAHAIGATDQHFFRALLGRSAIVFEAIYFAFLILVLSVFGSAAGAIDAAVAGLPSIVGTLALVGSVLVVCGAGQGAAEALFKYVSVLLYAVYALFLLLALWLFAPRIAAGFAIDVPPTGWAAGGITYAAYNVVGAVLVLPVLRHLRSAHDPHPGPRCADARFGIPRFGGRPRRADRQWLSADGLCHAAGVRGAAVHDWNMAAVAG